MNCYETAAEAGHKHGTGTELWFVRIQTFILFVARRPPIYNTMVQLRMNTQFLSIEKS